MSPLVDIGLNVTYVLIISAIALILIFAVIGIVKNIRNAISVLIAIVALIILFLISLALSSSTDVPEILFEKTGTNYALSRFIGAMLILLYFVFAGVIVSMLYTQIMSIFKNK